MPALQLLAFSILANSESSSTSDFSGLVMFLIAAFIMVFFGGLGIVYVFDTKEK